MAQIGTFCIDRYEASRPDATKQKEGDSSKDSTAVPTSRSGVLPWRDLTQQEARQACQRAGKRLCSAQEWEKACIGSKKTVYCYGDKYEPKTCNGIDAFGGAAWYIVPTGTFAKCKSDYGVYDINGNLWEYDNDASGYPRGGAFNCGDSASLHKCQKVRKDWPGNSNVGFRCCKDARKKP